MLRSAEILYKENGASESWNEIHLHALHGEFVLYVDYYRFKTNVHEQNNICQRLTSAIWKKDVFIGAFSASKIFLKSFDFIKTFNKHSIQELLYHFHFEVWDSGISVYGRIHYHDM